MEIVADKVEAVQEKDHQEGHEGLGYNLEETQISSLREIYDDCAGKKDTNPRDLDVSGTCISDITEDHDVERRERLYEEQEERVENVQAPHERYAEAQGQCFNDIEMNDVLDRQEKCLAKAGVERYEESEEGCITEREEMKEKEKNMTESHITEAGSSISFCEIDEDQSLKGDWKSVEALNNYPGTDETVTKFFSENSSAATKDDEYMSQGIPDVSKTFQHNAEDNEMEQDGEFRRIHSAQDVECQDSNAEKEANNNASTSISNEHNLNTVQNDTLIHLPVSEPSIQQSTSNSLCLESLNYDVNSGRENYSRNEKIGEEQAVGPFDRNHEESLQNVENIDGNLSLTDARGNVEDSTCCAMDASVCSSHLVAKDVDARQSLTTQNVNIVGDHSGNSSLMVGKDVFARIQGLLVQGQFSVDDLMKYFFTLHEWYMMSSSSSASFHGMSYPAYTSMSTSTCDKVMAKTPTHGVSEQDHGQTVQETKIQKDAIIPNETPASTLEEEVTKYERGLETTNLPSTKGCYQRQHKLLYRTDRGLYKCNICRFSNRSSLAYLAHIKLHRSEKNKCRICGKICGSLFSEHVHKNFHHRKFSKGTPLYYRGLKHLQKCEVCGEALWNKRQHSKLCKGHTYTDKKKREVFKCIKCGMCFNTSTMVQQHIMYHHVSKWHHTCTCGFRSQVLSPFLTHKKTCKYSYRNLLRNIFPKSSASSYATTVQVRHQSDQALEQTKEMENIYATGLHVLADVSEHRLSDVRDNILQGHASKDNVMDLSLQHHVLIESSSSIPSSSQTLDQTSFNLPLYQSAFEQTNLPLAVPTTHPYLEQSYSTNEQQSSLHRCNTIPVNNIELPDVPSSEKTSSLYDLQKLASFTASAIDLTSTDPQARRPSLENSENYKKERIRRNSGQGLERAISALRCKALSEMNRRKTADDICILKEEPGISSIRPKERYSIDSIVTHQVTVSNPTRMKSETLNDNQNSYGKSFGTAVIDLSKVNVGSMSQFGDEKVKSMSENRVKEASMETSPIEINDVFESIQENRTKRRNSSTVDEAVQDSLALNDDVDFSAIRVASATCHCPGCAKEFPSSSDLLQHIRTSCRSYYHVLLSQEKGKMECKICNINFFSHKQALIHHVRSVHGILLFGNFPARKALVCNVCHQTFMNEAYLREHINGKHFGARYSCTCGKTFKWRSSFSGHKRKCDGVITSTVNNRGRGKPLSIPRKRFESACSDSTLRMTWEQQKNGDTEIIRTEQINNLESKSMNSVPGIETLLANVRKERTNEGTPSLPSASSADSNLHTTVSRHIQHLLSKRVASNSIRDPNSLRISPKVKSFMEPIVQKATKGNLNRSTDIARQANSNISSERSISLARQANVAFDSRETNRKTNNVTVTNPSNILIKEEKNQGNIMPPCLSDIKTEKIESQESGQLHVNRDTQSHDKIAMQNSYPVSPYMLYPNLFNFHASNFLQEELHGSKSNTQKVQLVTTGNNLSNVPQANLFENPLMSVNSLVPFFANALSTLQQSVIPNTADPSLPDKPPHAEKTRPTTSSSASSTASASVSKNLQVGPFFSCNSCKKRFSSRKELENHPCKTYCSICKINFKCKASAREHMLGKHGGENRYSCPCGLRFKWRSSQGCHQRNCPKAPPKKSKILQ